jgi:DNA-binding transcriptional MerR regulator
MTDTNPRHPVRGGDLRIGDVARLAGTTPRTIRYYEEIGLLERGAPRPSGSHRLYSEHDVERLREVIRLRELLNVSLDELKTLLAAEEARAQLRSELSREDVEPERRHELLQEALGHIEQQLGLVRRRTGELAKLEAELADKRRRVKRRLRELTPSPPAAEPDAAAPAPAVAGAPRS